MEINKLDDYIIEVFFTNTDLEKYNLEIKDLFISNLESDSFYCDAILLAMNEYKFSMHDIKKISKIKDFGINYYVYKIILKTKIL